MRRLTPLLVAAVALVACGACGTPDRPLASGGSRPGAQHERHTPAAVTRPNFLVIVTDDQRADDFSATFMPRTWDFTVRQGVRFGRAYVTTALCCPSRASIFTGLYARHHGVRHNSDVLTRATVAARLHAAGYYTGQVGKYLNSWDGSPRPEFDFWVAPPFNDIVYTDPNLNVNGTWGVRAGYSTHILRGYALQFLRGAPRERPFLLYFTPVAPHGSTDPRTEPIPAPEDRGLYAGLPGLRPPSFNEADVSDKPAWLQAQPLLTAAQVNGIDGARRRRLESLRAVDRAVDSLLTLLARQGRLDDTFVAFLSDNGFFLGEHRLNRLRGGGTLAGKDRVYEEGHRVPLAVRYPPLAPAARVSNLVVANIDLAPTMYELAGVAPPYALDGRSLAPVLTGAATPWRGALLLESSLELAQPYSAVRTARYLYVETPGERSELYDRSTDPYQLRNAAADPAYAGVVRQLRNRLHGAW